MSLSFAGSGQGERGLTATPCCTWPFRNFLAGRCRRAHSVSTLSTGATLSFSLCVCREVFVRETVPAADQWPGGYMCHMVPAGSSQDKAPLQPASQLARRGAGNQERAVGVCVVSRLCWNLIREATCML